MTFDDFFWYVMSIIFLPNKYLCKCICIYLLVLLSSFHINPENPISYVDLLDFFIKTNNTAPVMDDIISYLPQRSKQFITYDEFLKVYETRPKYFQLVNDLQKDYTELLGNKFVKNIIERRDNIKEIMLYQDTHGKYPPESCCSKINIILFNGSPKYRYDYSIEEEMIDKTYDSILIYYCKKYQIHRTSLPITSLSITSSYASRKNGSKSRLCMEVSASTKRSYLSSGCSINKEAEVFVLTQGKSIKIKPHTSSSLRHMNTYLN